MTPRLQEKYQNEIRSQLLEGEKFQNINQVPRLEKIIVHMGVSPTIGKDALEDAARDLSVITGRKPVHIKAKRSVSNFKLRKGMMVGCRVTLRRQVMYEFFDRLISAALPRIRDFRGISPKSFDGQGNYSMGVNDQSVFPEIDMDRIKRTQGMDITIVTTAVNDNDALDFLKQMGMPFAGSN